MVGVGYNITITCGDIYTRYNYDVWFMDGLSMVYLYMVDIWFIYIWLTYGLCMVYDVWLMYGLCMVYDVWLMYGLCGI